MDKGKIFIVLLTVFVCLKGFAQHGKSGQLSPFTASGSASKTHHKHLINFENTFVDASGRALSGMQAKSHSRQNSVN